MKSMYSNGFSTFTGLASGPELDDHDPLADYRGDGGDLTALTRLLFDARQERQTCAS